MDEDSIFIFFFAKVKRYMIIEDKKERFQGKSYETRSFFVFLFNSQTKLVQEVLESRVI